MYNFNIDGKHITPIWLVNCNIRLELFETSSHDVQVQKPLRWRFQSSHFIHQMCINTNQRKSLTISNPHNSSIAFFLTFTVVLYNGLMQLFVFVVTFLKGGFLPKFDQSGPKCMHLYSVTTSFWWPLPSGRCVFTLLLMTKKRIPERAELLMPQQSNPKPATRELAK